MLFYSETLKKLFSSEKECREAESAYLKEKKKAEEEAKQKQTNRQKAAKEIEEQYKKVKEEYTIYRKLLKEFIDEYGYYHMSLKWSDDQDQNWFKFFY